ncbi:MAG TPA: Uma2 family endonuclease [Tepidisphaeraceae bacterium]|jgi:Uma2 family endonuclease|nr:Uma2 family endonuclease [Tepidisphaeraceae bacterium]
MLTANLPSTKRFSLTEYHRLVGLGAFDGQRVELIDGELIEMPPIGDAHAMAISLGLAALQQAFGSGYLVRPQLPITLVPASEPEPDLLVVRGTPRDFPKHPRDALLIVEVSDSTLHYDQTRKMSLYAKGGIPEYWIINIPDGQLEVHRDPVADRARPFGRRYSTVLTFKPGQSIAPLALPRKKIAVADLLP